MSLGATYTYHEGPRPFIITPNDHRGVVVAVAAVFIVYAYLIIGMRLAARGRTMGTEDGLATLATLFATVQFGIAIRAASRQYGLSYDQYSEDDAVTVAKELVRASDIFLLISLCTVKAAVIWLCRKLFSVNQRKARRTCDVTLAVSILWGVASILAIAIGCDDQAAIGFPSGSCPGLAKRWIVIGTFDGIIEIMIFSLSVTVIWPLRMSLYRRSAALTCFSFRILILVFVGLHLHYLSKSIHGGNRGVTQTTPFVLRQTELLFSLFSAAVPAINKYLRKFQTTGAATFGYAPGMSCYGLKSLSDPNRHQPSGADTTDGNNSFTPQSKVGSYLATIEYGYDRGRRTDNDEDIQSIGRQNSDDMIIRKAVAYEIAYSDSETASKNPTLSN